MASARPYTCWSCACRRFAPYSGFCMQKRFITQKWVRKTQEAKERWEEQAEKIRAGEKESMLSMLEQRGYINSIAGGRKNLESLMTSKRIGAYVGIDPTAPSMHVGHLVPLMCLFWLYVNGFKTISVLGGGTARVGDPSGRTTTREPMSPSTRKENMASMHLQLRRIWANVDKYARNRGYTWEWAWSRALVNNNTWLHKLSITELLHTVGEGVRVGTMLGRDTARKKLKGEGLSFSELTYPLLQSWDWWYMYQTRGIQLQIGGSDQYGNIIAGIDAINYIRKNHFDPLQRQDEDDPLMRPIGFTVPLLTTASGEKFGKSAGNAIWLDGEQTSSFELHQFFMRSADSDVERYLRLFTFIPLPKITQLMTDHTADPSKRTAQRRLAAEVVELVHGAPAVSEAETQAAALFRPINSTITSDPDTSNIASYLDISNTASDLDTNNIASAAAPITEAPPATATRGNKPSNLSTDVSPSLNPHATQTNSSTPLAHINLPQSLVYNQPIARVLYAAGLVSSRSEGHRLCGQQGAYVGNRSDNKGGMSDDLQFRPAKNWLPSETNKYIIDGELMILRVGKWKIKVVRIISDEEFDRLGLDAPGWKKFKEERARMEEDDSGVPREQLENTKEEWKNRNENMKVEEEHSTVEDPPAEVGRM